MNKQIVAAITCGVWLSALGSAAALIYLLDRPLAAVVATAQPRMSERAVRHPAEETVEPSELVIPTVVIVGDRAPRPGVAEMQGTHEVIVGPGVVTHPR